MSSRHGFWFSFVVMLLLLPLAGCGGDDDDRAEKKPKPVAGTFVGKVRGTEAFVAVVASPPAKGQPKRDVTVYVCDARRVCEWFSGSASGNGFTVTAGGGQEKARGKLGRAAVTGTIDLPGGETPGYKAGPASATAGLYELTVSPGGTIRGASAAGVGLTGKSSLPRPGKGTLKLADGRRLKFDVTRNTAGDAIRLKAGQLRLIVLPDGQLKGAGRSRPAGGGGGSNFFIRSSAK